MDGQAVSFIAVGLALGLGAVKDSLLTGARTREELWAAARARTRREYKRLEMNGSAAMMTGIFGSIGRAEMATVEGAAQPPKIYRAPEVGEIPSQLVERAAGSMGRSRDLVADRYDYEETLGLPPMAFGQVSSALPTMAFATTGDGLPPMAARRAERQTRESQRRPQQAFKQKALSILTG